MVREQCNAINRALHCPLVHPATQRGRSGSCCSALQCEFPLNPFTARSMRCVDLTTGGCRAHNPVAAATGIVCETDRQTPSCQIKAFGLTQTPGFDTPVHAPLPCFPGFVCPSAGRERHGGYWRWGGVCVDTHPLSSPSCCYPQSDVCDFTSRSTTRCPRPGSKVF